MQTKGKYQSQTEGTKSIKTKASACTYDGLWKLHIFVHLCVCECVCVCVSDWVWECERERERKAEKRMGCVEKGRKWKVMRMNRFFYTGYCLRLEEASNDRVTQKLKATYC